MPLEAIAECRLRAERCLIQAQSTEEFAIRLQWLALAEEWRALAESGEESNGRQSLTCARFP